MLCKRVKNGVTHYVKSVTHLGRIDYLTAKRDEACDLTADQVEKVKASYAKRPDAGTLAFEPAVPPAAPEKTTPSKKTEEHAPKG